jgi:hypothetical protein
MRNYVYSERQRTGNEPNKQYYYHGYCTHGPNQKYIPQNKSPEYLFRRSQEIQGIRITMSYIFIGRRKKEKLEKSENSFKISLIHNIEI